jgi:hypothetical protein
MPTSFTKETKPTTTFTREGVSILLTEDDNFILNEDDSLILLENSVDKPVTTFTKESKSTTTFTKETKP